MNLVSYSRSSKIQSPFERVLPQHVRESLVKRPQVALKAPQQAPKRPQVVIWPVIAGAALLGLTTLLSVTHQQAVPTPIPHRPTPTPTAVAEYVPPKAELISPPAPRAKLMALPNWRVGRQQLVRMPDGLQVLATLKGSVFSASQLPATGNHIGDTYVLGDNSEWVWLTAPGSNQASWIDP